MPNSFAGFRLQEDPAIVVAMIPGRWLLDRTTTSWRLDDPERGFQRVVRDERAETIAANVLDEERTFPNAIVLATDTLDVAAQRGRVILPERVRFLVVDGQHRLWAQQFSEFEAPYCCMIHLGLVEEEMASLFVEINNNQRRVPPSLRWDLVRLVRSDDDPGGVRTVDLVFDLNEEKGSPLYQRIDLTGEQGEIKLKQGSLAPAIKSLVATARAPLYELSYDQQYKVLLAFFSAIRECDTDGWRAGKGPLYGARVMRALLRLLGDILEHAEVEPEDATASLFLEYLSLIDQDELHPDKVRAQQGNAGVAAMYASIRSQVFEEQ